MHDPAGVLEATVNFAPGSVDATVSTPELALLVQSVVDRPDWGLGKTVGFLMSSDTMLDRFVGFVDSSSGNQRARLELTFTPP